MTMTTTRTAATVAAVLVVLAFCCRADAAALPSWITFSRGQAPPTIPALTAERVAALKEQKHGHVERLRRIEVDLRPGNVLHQRTVLARQLLDETGVREAGTLSLYARSTTDRVIIESAHALSPTGERRPFDPSTVQVLTVDKGDLFSDLHELAFPFAGLDVGWTVVVVARIERDRARWPLPWSEVIYTQSGWPLETFELSVRWRPDQRAPVWKTDDPALACRRDGPRLECRRERIPALVTDPDVVSWPDLMPHVVLAEDAAWASLVAVERDVLRGTDGNGAAIAQLAARLTKGAADDAQRIDRLFRFVADQIRYVGLEHGASAVVPRPASVTVERRYGDCKDKVALFLALARRAGLDAYPVLVATDRRDPRKLLLPSWKYFDHVVACVRRARERPTCVDPTNNTVPPGVLPLGLRGAVVLPTVDGGAPTHLPLAPGDAVGWKIEVASHNQVACDGSIVETVTRRYAGASAGAMRGHLRSRNADQRKRWLEEGYEAVMGRDVKATFTVEGLGDPAEDVVIRSSARFPAKTAATAWPHLVDPDAWLVSIGRDFRTGNRHHPYVTSGLHLTSRTTYALCAAVRPTLAGAELDFSAKFGRLTRRYDLQTASRPAVLTELVIPGQSVGQRDLQRFNEFLDAVLGQARIWIGLQTVGGAR